MLGNFQQQKIRYDPVWACLLSQGRGNAQLINWDGHPGEGKGIYHMATIKIGPIMAISLKADYQISSITGNCQVQYLVDTQRDL